MTEKESFGGGWSIDRRSYLAALSASAGVTLAGCSADDDSEPEGDGDEGGQAAGDSDADPETDADGDGETAESDSSQDLPDTFGLGATSPVFPVFYYTQFPILQERLQENHGIELESGSFAGPTAMTGGILQDEIQMGYISPAALTSVRNEGMPLVALSSVVHQFYHGLVVEPDTISDWEDLRGADVAVHAPLTSSTVLTESIIEAELGEVDAVNYQNVIGTTSRMAQLESGEVDAIIAFLSGALQTEQEGYGEVMAWPWDYDHLGGFPTNYWVAPEPVVDDNEETYRVLVEELQASFEQVYEEDTQDIVDRALATDISYPEFPEETWHRAFEMATENDMWPQDYETNMSIDRTEAALDFSVELGLLEEDERLSAEEILDTRFVGEI